MDRKEAIIKITYKFHEEVSTLFIDLASQSFLLGVQLVVKTGDFSAKIAARPLFRAPLPSPTYLPYIINKRQTSKTGPIKSKMAKTGP